MEALRHLDEWRGVFAKNTSALVPVRGYDEGWNIDFAGYVA
jgi:hypothetical protein